MFFLSERNPLTTSSDRFCFGGRWLRQWAGAKLPNSALTAGTRNTANTLRWSCISSSLRGTHLLPVVRESVRFVADLLRTQRLLATECFWISPVQEQQRGCVE